MDRIAYIDFDGTIADAKKRMAEIFNLYYKPLSDPPINGELIHTWDGGIPAHLVEHVFAHDKFFHGLEIFKGFEDAMYMLKDKGFKIVLYTKGSLLNIAHKAEYVSLFMGDIFDGWHFVGTNDLGMGKSQLDMSVSNGYSIIIDDHVKNLKPLKTEHSSNMPTYSICCKLAKCKNEEWNIDWTNKNMTIYNWSELESIIDRIENYETNVIR